jgi:hypothetical protein
MVRYLADDLQRRDCMRLRSSFGLVRLRAEESCFVNLARITINCMTRLTIILNPAIPFPVQQQMKFEKFILVTKYFYCRKLKL